MYTRTHWVDHVVDTDGKVLQEGTPLDQQHMNNIEEGIVELERRVVDGFKELDPTGAGVGEVTVQLYSCVKTGSVYALTGTGTIGRCKIPATWESGDSFTVNGNAVPAYCGADAVDGDSIVAGRWALFVFDGAQLNFNGGGGLSSGKLAQATAAESDVLSGKKFYAGNKNLKTGTLALSGSAETGDVLKGASFYKDNPKSKLTGTLALSGNANAAQVLSEYTFYKDNAKSKLTGTMPNRGAVSTTIAPGGSYTILAGYHNGSGKVYGGTSLQFVWGFTCHANRNNYTLGTNSSFGTANGSTWTCKKAGKYRIRAVYSDSIGQSGAGVKKNGSWLFNGAFGDKTQDVSLTVGNTIQIVGGPIYGDPYGPCVATIVIWAI